MTAKQKLELTWIGKDKRPQLEPRILLEDASKSCHAKHRVTYGNLFDNRLIFGDNLLTLKALEQEFPAGRNTFSLPLRTTPAMHSLITMTGWTLQSGWG